MIARTHILIAEAAFYTHISAELERGAVAVLQAAGATWERVVVPGAFELPAAVRFAVAAREQGMHSGFDGFVALGCVIRGETSHYDIVCQEAARGLQDLALRHDLALGFGLLTVENEEQALVRASIEQKDKGGEAARACLAMLSLRRRFGLERP